MAIEELWKFLPFKSVYDYEVSNKGNIRRKGILLKPFVDTNGYFYINLYFGVKIAWKVAMHYLVLRTFTGPAPEGLTETNHKNGNKQDNCHDNLEYCTRSYNALHAWKTGLQTKGHSGKLKSGEIWLIRRLAGRFPQHFIGKMFKITQSMVSRIVSRECY